MAKTNNGYEGLDTITTDGKPPASRMESAMAAANRVQVLLRAESRGRAPRRALVKGLVDGNPPYRKTDMQKAGRAGQCNVNWRIAEYYLNRARAAFYDVYSEAATYATIRTKDGNSDQKERWSEIISKEFDTMLREDRTWDYSQQISQHEMVLYGAGPLVFEDDIDWRNCSVLNKDCIVPDFAPSNTAQWEELVILKDYSPHQLYNFIRKEKIASEQGWDVDGTKKAIMAAHPKTVEGSQYQTWEWHQQQLKNQSYGYTSQSKVIPCAHYFFREFPEPGHPEGKITHTILISPNDAQIEGSEGAEKYLFRRVGRFDNWDEIIHPMYYDNDGGGYHHSVTGMGQKMYSAMEFQNRLLCNIADKTFAPKVLFKPTTAAAREQLAMVQFGEYGQVPNGFDVLQTPVGSYAEEALVFNREVTNLLSSNLSQYNSANQKPSGNPITATQAQIDASEQARLGKTQLNHYYNQLDCLYAEKYRRATRPGLNGHMPGGREAMAFWKRCKDKGVPISALRNVESVKSTRIIGQGSQFMRQQAIEKMLSTVALWPSEQGRNNLISDFIASLAGQGLVERYNPQSFAMGDLEDQRAFAHVQIASAKDGIAPIVTGSQNHFLFASEFMMAGAQAMQSLQIGGNPLEVYAFIEVIGPAIATHLQYVAKDPTRATIYKQLTQQWKQLAQMHSKLGQQIEQQQQQAQQRASMEQQAQAMENGNDPEIRLRNAEAAHKMQLKQREKEHSMQLKELQTRQKMELADVSTASKINNARRQAESKESSSSE